MKGNIVDNGIYNLIILLINCFFVYVYYEVWSNKKKFLYKLSKKNDNRKIIFWNLKFFWVE